MEKNAIETTIKPAGKKEEENRRKGAGKTKWRVAN